MSRKVLMLITASLLTWVAAAPRALAEAPQMGTQAPGFYRMRLGHIEITALSDGTHTFPIPQVMVRARPDGTREPLGQARPGEAEALLAQEHLALPYEGSINAFLINTGSRLVLIDSGAGELYGACCGHLPANLRAAGYLPEQVDEVLLTHFHADHVGGIAIAGRALFPNAVIRMSRKDYGYWLDLVQESKAPAFLHPMFEGARAVLKPYIDAGRVESFDSDGEVSPGIVAIATPGHTPGHTSYRVTSDGKVFLAWGDVVHVSPIQFPDPHVTVTYDTDASVAEAQRKALFNEAADHGLLVGAAHIAFPGLGHVIAHDGRFVWLPSPYTTQVQPSH